MKAYCFILFCFVDSLLFGQAGFSDPSIWEAQLALTGHTGLIITPSAYLSPDRQLAFGYGYIPDEFSLIEEGTFTQGDHIYYLNIGFLPFIETTLRLTKPVNSRNLYGIGDRSFFFRINVLKEKRNLPAITIGLHDPFGTGLNNTSYLVASKSLQVSTNSNLTVSGGYGTRLSEIFDAKNYYLTGFFGGVTYSWKEYSIALENDTDQFNLAIKSIFWKERLNFQAALLGMKSVTGSIGMKFKI